MLFHEYLSLHLSVYDQNSQLEIYCEGVTREIKSFLMSLEMKLLLLLLVCWAAWTLHLFNCICCPGLHLPIMTIPM